MIYLAPINGAVLFVSTEKICLHLCATNLVIFQTNNTPSGEPIDESAPSTSSMVAVSRPTSGSAYIRPNTNIKEDDVDLQLYKMDGKIQRKKDEKL